MRILPIVATLVGLAAVLPAGTAAAQDERRLKQVFEGKRVTALLDLPATAEGVDILPGSNRPLDFQKYSARIKKSGVSIKEGEKSIITKIRVKDNVLEADFFNGVLVAHRTSSGQ